MAVPRRRKTGASSRSIDARWIHWSYRGLSWAALLVFLSGLPFLLDRLSFPFQLAQDEAVNVFYSRPLAAGLPLYHDPNQPPYLFTAYPPLFFHLETLAAGILPGLWLPGRLLAFTGYMGCAALLGLWGWRHWRKDSALLPALLFLLSPTWMSWGTMARVDSLALFFHFGAFLLLLKNEQDGEPGFGRWAAAGILTAAAILTKQTSITLLLAWGIRCLYRRDWKALLWTGISALAPLLTVWTLEQWRTGGLFGDYILKWVAFGYGIRWLLDLLRGSFLPECGLLLAASLFVLWRAQAPGWVKVQWAFSALWLGGLGREGGAENYYLEFVLYSLFLVGAARWDGAARGGRIRGGAFFPLVLWVLVFAGFSRLPWPQAPSSQVAVMKEDCLRFFEQPGDYLALDEDLPLTAGKPLFIQPMEYTHLVEKGYWSDRPLLDDIHRHGFRMIELYDLSRQYLLPPEVEEEIEKDYYIAARAYGRRWYLPRAPKNPTS